MKVADPKESGSEQGGHVKHDLSLEGQIGPQKQMSTHDGKDLVKIFHPKSKGGHGAGAPCSSEVYPLRGSKGKRRRQSSRIVFIPKRLSLKLVLAEPTWFWEIKFSDIPGIRDMRAKPLFPIEIKKVGIFYKPEF